MWPMFQSEAMWLLFVPNYVSDRQTAYPFAIKVAAGKIGQAPAPPGTQFELQVNALGRLSEPEQFGDIVVRSGRTVTERASLRRAN